VAEFTVGSGESGSAVEVPLPSGWEDLVFFLCRLGAGGEPSGSYRFPRLLDEASGVRPSVRRGMPEDNGAVTVGIEGELSISSASPRYLGMPSTPISTLGGFLKWVLSRYSGLISREASSGREDGERRRPFSTSSIL